MLIYIFFNNNHGLFWKDILLHTSEIFLVQSFIGLDTFGLELSHISNSSGTILLLKKSNITALKEVGLLGLMLIHLLLPGFPRWSRDWNYCSFPPVTNVSQQCLVYCHNHQGKREVTMMISMSYNAVQVLGWCGRWRWGGMALCLNSPNCLLLPPLHLVPLSWPIKHYNRISVKVLASITTWLVDMKGLEILIVHHCQVLPSLHLTV